MLMLYMFLRNNSKEIKEREEVNKEREKNDANKLVTSIL